MLILDTCQKLHPLALAHKQVRILEVNRRGYEPTTLYTDDELKDLSGENGVDGYKAFWQRRALEIANLLLKLVQEKNLPAINAKEDGVVLMGWSMGTASCFGFLGQTDAPGITEKYEALKTHLRGVILYGTYPHPPISPTPRPISVLKPLCLFVDSSLFYATTTTPPADPHQFALFASNYYTHTSLGSGDLSSGDVSSIIHTDPRPSLYNLSDKERNNEALILTEWPMYTEAIRSTLVEQRTKSLFDPHRASTILPDISIVLIGCGKTPLGCVRGRLGVEKEYAEGIREGRKGRNIKVITIDEGNHFVSFFFRDFVVCKLCADGLGKGALG